MDVHVPSAITEGLRRRGIDVLAVLQQHPAEVFEGLGVFRIDPRGLDVVRAGRHGLALSGLGTGEDVQGEGGVFETFQDGGRLGFGSRKVAG